MARPEARAKLRCATQGIGSLHRDAFDRAHGDHKVEVLVLVSIFPNPLLEEARKLILVPHGPDEPCRRRYTFVL
jgi:hypothetical protein